MKTARLDFLDRPDADQRACLGEDPELFFPDGGDNGEEAKAICRSCPLLAGCREWALTQPPNAVHGVWGGLSDRDRRTIHRNRRPATNPEQTCQHCGVYYGNFIRPHLVRVHADQTAVAA